MISAFLQKSGRKFRGIYRYLATIQPLLRLVWQASPLFLVMSFTLTFLLGLLPLLTIFISSTLLQTLVQAVEPHGQRTLSASLVLLLLLLAGVNLLSQVVQYANMAVQRLHRTRVTNHVQMLIVEKAAAIDLASFEDPAFHNQLRTAANEASFRIPMFLDRLMMTGSSLITFLSLATVLLLWQHWIVPVMLLASLASFWVSTRFSTLRVHLVTERAETERMKFYLNSVLTSDQAAKEIRLFGLRDHLLSSFRTILETMYQQDRRLAVREQCYSGMAGILVALVQPILIAFTALQVLQGAITIGQFSLYTQAIMQVESALSQLLSLQSGLHENNLFAALLFDFLALQPRVEASHSQRGAHTISPRPLIEFRHVSFSYPGTEQAVLSDISFTICPGEAVALVGENGAGKTTLIKLLAGLYETTAGQILLDGVDIQTLDRAALRAHLSVIFQDYIIYHFSARENVGVGRVDWLHDFSRIEQAARRSGLDQVIAHLPNGYETVLGRFWQKGHELSGGQRQLVALARALLRDAPILVLDEPSAALDIYTEQHFFQQLLQDRESKAPQTVIFISHRLTSVRRADRILVLEHGRLIEEGTHEELLALGGAYAEMYALQTAPYGAPFFSASTTNDVNAMPTL